MNRSYLFASGVILPALVVSSPGMAQALNASVRDALERALLAQNEAAEALKKAKEAKAHADEAVKQAQALIDQSYGTGVLASVSEVTGQGPCDIRPTLDAAEMVSAATQYCTKFVTEYERAYSLNDLEINLNLNKVNDYNKKSAPTFSISTAKDGGYSGLGFNWRIRKYSAFNNATYRSTLWSITPQITAKVDKDDVPTLREYNAKDDATTWSSNLSVKLDIRRVWGYRYDLPSAQKVLEKKLQALIDKCKRDDGRPCADPNDLAAVDGAKDAYWEAVAPLWGLEKDGSDLPPQYYIGTQLQKGWNEVAYRPYFDPTTGMTLLPANPSDVAGDELEMKQHPLRFKFYGGGAFRFSLDEKAKNTPSDADKYFVVGVAGSVGWRRAYGLPEGTTDRDLCYPDAANLGYTKCIKSNTAKPYRSEGFTIGASLNAISADLPVIGRPWLSVGYERDLDLK